MRLFLPPHACFRCAHSSSSLPLQSAAYASASTRSLCAPQRAHNAVSCCPVCSISSGQRPTSRAPAAQRAPCIACPGNSADARPRNSSAFSHFLPPRVGRFPCAPLRTTRDAAPSSASVALKVLHRPPPPRRARRILIYVYPPYTFTEIKYIYLTPILHTYTSHSIRRHTLYTSSTQPIRVYAYGVDTHWHAAHYSPPTFDRPRNEATRAKPVKGEEVVGKKNLQLSHLSIQ